MDSDAPPSLPANVRQWPKFLSLYREPSTTRSVVEIVISAGPLIALWVVMWAVFPFSPALSLILAIPAAGFLVRLFMIQHDCSHGAFFRRRSANDWVGRVIGVFTLTPHDHWQRTHAMHHAGVGNLAHRGIGDVTTMTVREYEGLGRWRRFGYRLYRHPLVLFGIGPLYIFFFSQRLPVGLMRGAGWAPWISAMATNAAILAVAGIFIAIIGVVPFLAIQVPTAFLAAAAGVWLFYVQHQFEETYWEGDTDWRHSEASLAGSSHYVLPGILRWFSANIGVHHVHHLNSRIPFYRLPEVLQNHPELASVGRLTLAQSLGCIRLALWDEGRRRLVSFREAKRTALAAQA